MDCLAVFDSGNYVYNICRTLEKSGFVFEVVSTPCQIARSGCGYSLKFPMEYMDLVIKTANKLNTPVREIYKIIPLAFKNKYERIY